MRIGLVAEAHAAVDLDGQTRVLERGRARHQQCVLDLQRRIGATFIQRHRAAKLVWSRAQRVPPRSPCWRSDVLRPGNCQWAGRTVPASGRRPHSLRVQCRQCRRARQRRANAAGGALGSSLQRSSGGSTGSARSHRLASQRRLSVGFERQAREVIQRSTAGVPEQHHRHLRLIYKGAAIPVPIRGGSAAAWRARPKVSQGRRADRSEHRGGCQAAPQTHDNQGLFDGTQTTSTCVFTETDTENPDFLQAPACVAASSQWDVCRRDNGSSLDERLLDGAPESQLFGIRVVLHGTSKQYSATACAWPPRPPDSDSRALSRYVQRCNGCSSVIPMAANIWCTS